MIPSCDHRGELFDLPLRLKVTQKMPEKRGNEKIRAPGAPGMLGRDLRSPRKLHKRKGRTLTWTPRDRVKDKVSVLKVSPAHPVPNGPATALSRYEKECGKVKHTALPADQPPAVVPCTTVCRPRATKWRWAPPYARSAVVLAPSYYHGQTVLTPSHNTTKEETQNREAPLAICTAVTNIRYPRLADIVER
ncbi:hypothetical protein Bbelb_142620 [Branchiostoma belcheri]|nr:hypothetical protein Bbelb_142620 [Branchiostoma belcheri]